MNRMRVLLADDHVENNERLCRLLQDDFDVIARVYDGYAMVGAAEVLAPDVIVADISMPGLDGILAATAILRRHPGARIVFVTAHASPALKERAMATGALGYVLKLAAGDELVPAVWAALQDDSETGRPPRPPAGE